MRADEMLKERRPQWEQLTRLLEQAERKTMPLSPEQVQLLGNLYRAATSDLALAKRDFPQHKVALYLNQLVGRAHAAVYQGEPLALGRLGRYIRRGFPEAFRKTKWFTFTATLLLFLPALFTALITYTNPEAARWILPPEVQHLIPIIQDQELWVDMAPRERPFMSSAIMTNNIQVSFLAFGGGMLAGLLTTYVLIFNGLMLGGLIGLTAHYGVGWELSHFIIGHGVVELSVICMAGGAGLQLGWAMLRPGLLHRRDALQLAGGQAIRLLVGCIPLLVIAGLIEGFISPAETISPLVKWGVGLGTGLLLYGYLFFAGRPRRH